MLKKSEIIEKIRSTYRPAKKVLLIPPDITRVHSRAGYITSELYAMYMEAGAEVHVLPALGTHLPMNGHELTVMFGDLIPQENFLRHDWRNDIIKLGEVSSGFVKNITGGLLDYSVDIQVNKLLTEQYGGYDLKIAVGAVVPHEVAGFSSYSKHVFVGCGGSSMINKTHFIGAVHGIERILGTVDNPVRAVFDDAQARFGDMLGVDYIMTVIGPSAGEGEADGLYMGRGRGAFEQACELSNKININHVNRVKKAVVFLDPAEYRSTWLGNKAIYRTRMMIADNGELIIIAPGVRMFGEDQENDLLIEKYGYHGRDYTLSCTRDNKDLSENLSVAAHLIHGSADGRFHITYAVDDSLISYDKIKKAGFIPASCSDMLKKYNINALANGMNTIGGEEFFYVSNPGLGLWKATEQAV